MFQGNWTCSGCGMAITELPFEPKGVSGLMCRDCHSKVKSGVETTESKQTPGEKVKVEGDWKCNSCGGAITSLPFIPRDTSNLLCIDCYKKKKGS